MKNFYSLLFPSLLLASLLSSPLTWAQGPTVVRSALSPAANTIAIPRTTPVLIPFSQAINSATAGNVNLFSSQYRGRRTVTASASGSTITLMPTAPAGQPAAFRPGETVTVSVPATVMGLAAAAAPYVYQFTAAASGGSGRFLPGSDPLVGTNPQCVVLGDVDNDGDLDLLTANSNANGTVSVRLNNGSGIFAGGSDVTVGSYPGNVALGDVDGDGDLDLATANSGNSAAYGNTVSIRLNDGTGNFTAPATNPNPTVGTNPKGVALGDVDGDGDLDLLTANYDFRNGTVSIRFNNGTGNFTAPATNAEVPAQYGTTGITLGDIDNDGDLDFATANSIAGAVSFRYNNGKGTFTSSSSGEEGPSGLASSVALGDLDGDGDLDYVTSNTRPSSGSNMATMAYNQDGGFFGIGFGIEVGPQPSAVALADVDGDGDLDLLAANSGNNTASVRLNNGHSSFSSTSNTVAVAVGSNPRSIAVGDVDGDGDLDLVTANAGNTVSVRLNALVANVVNTVPTRNALAAPLHIAPTLTFTQPLNPATVGGIRVHRQQGTGMHTAGASGPTATLALPLSSRPAFWPGEAVQITVPATISSSSGTAAVPFVYDFTAAVTGGTGVFVPGSSVSLSTSPMQVVAGDVDNDGDLDLLTATYSGNIGNVVVHRNNGLATFTAPTSVSIAGLTLCLELADVDNDGDLDLIAGRRNAGLGGVSIRLNDGKGIFSGTQEIESPGKVSALAIGDTDGDGDLDMVVSSTSIVPYFNNGNGVFTGTYGVGYSHASLQHGPKLIDVDADGDLDLIGINPDFRAALGIWINDGLGGFFFDAEVPVGNTMIGVVGGDVDGDGDIDFLVSDFTRGVYLLRSNGKGAYAGAATSLPNVPSGELTLGDIDADGDLDILSCEITPNNTMQASVRLNDGSGNFSGTGAVPLGAGLRTGIELADIDNDGDLDMLTPDTSDNTVSVWLNGGGPLAATSAAPSAAGSLFPNPAVATSTVNVNCSVPADARLARTTVLNALGQTVATGLIPVRAGYATGALPTMGLPAGVYTVRLQAGKALFTARLVLL